MNKVKYLTLELWLSILLSLAIAVGSGFLVFFVGSMVIYSSEDMEEKDRISSDAAYEDIQLYVEERDLSSSDMETFSDYLYAKYPGLYCYIMDDGTRLYDNLEYDDYGSAYEYYEYSLSFSDKTVDFYLYNYYEDDLTQNLALISLGIGLVIFILALTLFIRHKIRYIKKVSEGIHVLEGGDLDYKIEVRGKDEIADLANSLNYMSDSLKEQRESERQALMANSSLVTALSHDLRTPLTTQMGYLEILKEGHYKDREELDKYLDTCYNTCTQIKEMSDRMFEYFLAFDPHPERKKEDLEKYDALSLFMQMIWEHTILLEESGFAFDIREPELPFYVSVNPNDIGRVFRNIFSNIEKYADESEPVVILIEKTEKQCLVSFTNVIRSVPRKNESAKIGLESIRGLMRRQGGGSEVNTEGNRFSITLNFPLAENEDFSQNENSERKA